MTDLTPGIYTMPADVYHADPCSTPSLSSTIARTLLDKSAAHARAAHPHLTPNPEHDDADHLDIGTIAHSILLEGNSDQVDIIDVTDWRTKDAKALRDASRAAGRIPIKIAEWANIDRMVSAVVEQLNAHQAHPALLAAGLAEQTLIWQEDDVTCRARLDWLRDDRATIDDIKTTAISANPLRVARTIFNNGYDFQAAFYLRGLKAITGATAEFRFVFVETTAPYGLSVITLSPAALALADEKVTHAIRLWAGCVERDDWPAYSRKVATAELPGWAESQWFAQVDAEEAA